MINKSGFIWNMIGSVIYAIFSAIILAFCTRLNGIEIAGIFSIVYATSCIMNSIGDFGIRIYQVTDTKKNFTFSDYFSARIISVAIMIASSLIIAVFSGYTSTKFAIYIILIIYRIIDNISETFQAEFQINDRLDLGGKSMVYRNIISILIFIIINLISKNIILSCIGMTLGNLFIFLIFDVRVFKKINKDKIEINYHKAKNIVKECFPIGLATVLNVYVINAVKYAIDNTQDYTMQTYFNIIYMPTFAINLISIFLIKPFLKIFGEYWNNREYKKLYITINKIVAMLIVATIIIELICFFIAIPILNIFYGVEISEFKLDLMILVVSGLLYAICNLFFNILGTMRKQKYISYIYIIISIFSYIVPKFIVKEYGMRGAVISNLMIMFELCLLFIIFFIKGIKNGRRVEKDEEI